MNYAYTIYYQALYNFPDCFNNDGNPIDNLRRHGHIMAYSYSKQLQELGATFDGFMVYFEQPKQASV